MEEETYYEIRFSLEVLFLDEEILNGVKIEKNSESMLYELDLPSLFYDNVAGLIHELAHLLVFRRFRDLKEKNLPIFSSFSEFYASAISYLLKDDEVFGETKDFLEKIEEFLKNGSENFAFERLGRYILYKVREKLEPLYIKNVETAFEYFIGLLKEELEDNEKLIDILSKYPEELSKLERFIKSFQ